MIEELRLKDVNIEFKIEKIDDQTATVVVVDDLFAFTGFSQYGAISKIEAVSKTVEYLLNFRNFISRFKSGWFETFMALLICFVNFFFLAEFERTKCNPETSINALNEEYPSMIEKKVESVDDEKKITIAILNLASITETASSENEAFKTASFKLCEYLRRIAQIGHLEMIDIFLQ